MNGLGVLLSLIGIALGALILLAGWVLSEEDQP